jgi:hypothetical protein
VEKVVASEEMKIWVYPINMKALEFGIFSHLYPDKFEDEETLCRFSQ